jgi:hypothetical protein
VSRRPDGVVWPSPAQELLLHAALGEGGEAARAWEAWSRVADVDSADPGSQRLFPLVYRRLAAAGVDDPRLDKLKGVLRHSWSRNQLLFHHGAAAVRAFGEAGIDTLLLKGAALATLVYRDPGVRPMEDLDLLVHRQDAARAMDVLRAAGWHPTSARPEERLAVWHADSFVDEGGRALDLHWNALWQLSDDAELWAASVPAALNGVPTRALGHADQLLHVCVHGLRWASVPPIRWVADGVLTVRAAGPALDWGRLVRVARANDVTLAAGHALAYLREAFAAPVPEEVTAELAAARKPVHERLAFRAHVGRPAPHRMLAVLWDRHRRLPDRGSFVAFVQRHSGVERRSQLPAHLARKLRRGRWRDAP